MHLTSQYSTASWQSNPSILEFVVVALIRILPHSVLKILKLVSTRTARELASVGELAGKVAREILAAQAELGMHDESDKDIVDILSKSRNYSVYPNLLFMLLI